MSADTGGRSPYERALGARIAELHPKTAWYFRTIPAGHVGVGTGVFRTAGSRNRLLRPLLRLAEAAGVAFAGWESDVPFRVENRTVNGRAVATREFALPGRTWTMHDAVALTPSGILRDEVGRGGVVVTTFDIAVRDGTLVLSSRRVGVRIGGIRIPVPAFLSPTVSLVERWDEASRRHHVDMSIDAPVLGRVYGYTGFFEYAIREENT